jgi:hypothetical protein
MEPLHPDLRKALKAAHPGLTDDDLDQYEKLTSMRFTLDPDRFRESIEEIDRARMQLVATRMPQLAQIERIVNAQLKARQPEDIQRVTMEIRREGDDSSKGSR